MFNIIFSAVTVNIRHRPGRAVITPEEAIAVAGRSVTLVCSADPEGYPKPTYRYIYHLYITLQPAHLLVAIEISLAIKIPAQHKYE